MPTNFIIIPTAGGYRLGRHNVGGHKVGGHKVGGHLDLVQDSTRSWLLLRPLKTIEKCKILV